METFSIMDRSVDDLHFVIHSLVAVSLSKSISAAVYSFNEDAAVEKTN